MNKIFLTVLITVIVITLFSDQHQPQEDRRIYINTQKIGLATWYDKGKYKNGKVFRGDMYSCASAHFPRYSLLLVENRKYGEKVLVWNNDVHEENSIVIDLSKKAFKNISKLKLGKIEVIVTLLCITKSPNPLIFGSVQ